MAVGETTQRVRLRSGFFVSLELTLSTTFNNMIRAGAVSASDCPGFGKVMFVFDIINRARVWNICLRKVRFKTQDAVEKACYKKKAYDSTIYHCPLCEGWHSSHQRKEKP